MKEYKCIICHGSGEVHSHNPKCWACDGTGRVDFKTAEKDIRDIVIPYVSLTFWYGGKPFGEKEQNDFVTNFLKKNELK